VARYLAVLLAGSAALLTLPASAATVKLDVTVTSGAGNMFSAPIFTFTNLSDAGVDIAEVSVNGGPPWDYAWDAPTGSVYDLLDPAGGTRTILIGEERTTDGNNGCTASIAYGLTSFDSGDFFRVALDPEAGGCGSAVIDIRSFLNRDTIGIGVLFSNGISLASNDWAFELIDPLGSPNADDNQLYRMQLSAVIPNAVPEPATWGLMIAGFAMVGTAMRRRKTRIAFA
jgi:hypothetical protein